MFFHPLSRAGISGDVWLKDFKPSVQIRRDASSVLLPFTDYFKGFEKVEAVREQFGADTEKVIRDLKVEFFSAPFGYMGTSDVDGHLLVSTRHLKESELAIIYLDIIHELCHVKQFLDGRKLFNSDYEYVDNPTEVEAYRYTVKEARRIGMPENEIIEYLKVEWIDEKQHARLVRRMGIKMPRRKGIKK